MRWEGIKATLTEKNQFCENSLNLLWSEFEWEWHDIIFILLSNERERSKMTIGIIVGLTLKTLFAIFLEYSIS